MIDLVYFTLAAHPTPDDLDRRFCQQQRSIKVHGSLPDVRQLTLKAYSKIIRIALRLVTRTHACMHAWMHAVPKWWMVVAL